MLDVRRLAVLRAFAVHGTIARAADALAFTPSAVSQQLAQLQREAGVELLVKVGRRLELSDAGRTLVERGEELLGRVEEIEAELAAQAGEVRGRVRVAAFQTATRSIVLPALERLARDHPELRVELLEEEAEASFPLLMRGAVDVAVAEEYEHAPRPRPAGLERVYLEPDELLLALPSNHAALDGDGPVALSALRNHPWASARAGTAYADMCTGICRSAGGFEPDVRHRANDIGLLLDLVVQGCAALVPALGAPQRDRRIAVRPLREGRFSRAIFVALRRSDRLRPSTGAAVAALARTAPS
jgi:DNA-binding transcriptional LysR family regulator